LSSRSARQEIDIESPTFSQVIKGTRSPSLVEALAKAQARSRGLRKELIRVLRTMLEGAIA
jgi:hypothetical protein